MKSTRFIPILIAVSLLHIILLSKKLSNTENIKTSNLKNKKVQVSRIRLKRIAKKNRIIAPPKLKTIGKLTELDSLMAKIEDIKFKEEEVSFDFQDIEYTDITNIDDASYESGRGNNETDLKSKYLNSINGMINIDQIYPKMAKRMRIKGIVKVSFSIMNNGEIRQVVIKKSSGFNILDNAALEKIKNIKKIEPIPKKLNINKLTCTIPMRFQLK